MPLGQHSPFFKLWNYSCSQLQQLCDLFVHQAAQSNRETDGLGIANTRHSAFVVGEVEAAVGPSTVPTENESFSHNTTSPGELTYPYPNVLVPSTSFFSGAHDIVLHNPVMTVNTVGTENEVAALKLLKKKAIVESALDSAARYPPPLCHPGTRDRVLDKIKAWLSSLSRESNLLWLHGCAGVGKSAVAQTIGEYCLEQGWLGASFFFSRPNQRNDPARVIPSIAHQLAIALRSYRQAVTSILAQDNTILDKTIKVQFDRLIVKLASYISHSEHSGPHHPILILLDGLDECASLVAQQELIDLITAFASTCKSKGLPIVWMITSRPEWHIVSKFDQITLDFWRQELYLSGTDDIKRFLRDIFVEIYD